jgi:hypothetical protein
MKMFLACLAGALFGGLIGLILIGGLSIVIH